MASKKARKPNRTDKILTRSHFKKQLPQHNNNNTSTTTLDQTSASSSLVSTCSSSTTSFSPPSPSPAVLGSSPGGGGGCCTPKAQKSRIPEMLTCPPAPKKQRVTKNCVLRRRQIVFFAPPEIELFFVNAHDR
ncbi:hypothetical protein CARUB_v10015841mg [Capsella rubella]|uniref:Cyclin-dependent protein kinase inhibitor SMR13 n=1 Tax=Capsella rubella TaxID=81985 RepID=R0GA48_9BRAS|nr:cyclin-dependent protein kinase inhibitor SMR13 [Capsella rubella]EOA32552.1 hypothetical protein CARUB_v10015841mg [Capsella rubella]